MVLVVASTEIISDKPGTTLATKLPRASRSSADRSSPAAIAISLARTELAAAPKAPAEQLPPLAAPAVIQKGEYKDLGITTREQFALHIESVVNKPTAFRELSGGRTAYWDNVSGTVVIRNPKAVDGGTAFRPVNGKAYFDGLR